MKRSLNITFVLPMFLDNPAGGFKSVYEYASRLQRRGHQVSVVHPRRIEPQPGIIETIKSRLWAPKLRLKYRPLIPWFDVTPGVALKLVPDLSERNIPDADVVFATAFNTAFPVASYAPRKGRKFYLIQSYEDWSGPEAQVQASWRLPMQKIVISQALLDTARALGEAERAVCIPLAIDSKQFHLTRPMEERNSAHPGTRVGMLAHPNENKGVADGLAALELARHERPDLQAVLFGTHRRAPEIPAWIEYLHRPTPARLRAMYNDCSIYLNPSWTEGFGLTSVEAMACGCALVTADNGGAREFAGDEQTALLAPIKQPEALAAQLLRLLRDDELRLRIARAGNQAAQVFDWERMVDALEPLLLA